MKDLVLTLIGPDRPGLVESLAKRVAAHGGNWLESRMAHLAGQFAGVLRIEVPPEAIPALQAALAELEAEGLRVVAESGAEPEDTERRAMELQLVGQDHPGIVRDVSQVLLQHGVNIEELTTDHVSAPMSGGQLFSARARLHVLTGADTDKLRRDLEKIADDLMVDLALAQTVIGKTPSPR
jgi:glycine cleavage system regulatory protein